MPAELFFSLHNDENHTDCILRACVVHLAAEQPDGSMQPPKVDTYCTYGPPL